LLSLFPSHEQLESDVKSRNIRQGSEGGVNFLLQIESWEWGLTQSLQLKGKPKSPSLLVLLSSQTPHGAASSVLEEQSNICRQGSHVLATVLR